MGPYLIDTNVFSHYFSERLSQVAMTFVEAIVVQAPSISIITSNELLSWVIPDKRKEEEIRSFINSASVINLSAEIAAVSVKIRRSKRVKMPDAIIGATAIVENMILITSDEGSKTIDGLRVFDPSGDFL